MKLSNLIIYSITGLFIAACSTEEVSPEKSITEFLNLEVGNYWVYDWYEIEPDGTESPFNRRDSVYIESNTLIEGRIRYIKTGTFLGNAQSEIVFDSANSFYSYPSRELLFTLDETQELTKHYGSLENPIAIGHYSLNSDIISVVVPAGAFECLNFEGIIESLDQDYQYGTRQNANLYSDNIGLVKMTTQFFSSPNDLEMRLVKYGKH